MTAVTIQKQENHVVVTEDASSVNVTTSNANVVLTAPGSQGPPRSEDSGVIYLKNNAIPTPIATINGRAVVSGVPLRLSICMF